MRLVLPDRLFDLIVCVEDYARGKPFPDPFLEAARQLRVPAAAGMDCVLVAPGA